jgi:hypothetical protein
MLAEQRRNNRDGRTWFLRCESAATAGQHHVDPGLASYVDRHQGRR